MLRLSREMPEIVEDEWDPQGLNSIAKDELESFSEEAGEEDETTEEEPAIMEDDQEEEQSKDLDLDGLTELEQMERNLLQEESFDFAMVGEEE